MTEPDWSRLPFATRAADWRACAEAATASDAAALVAGQSATPVVWLEKAAIATFAIAADVSDARAWLELGAGVLRWFRQHPLADGTCYAVRFRGALGLELQVGRLGDCLLVHLPRSREIV